MAGTWGPCGGEKLRTFLWGSAKQRYVLEFFTHGLDCNVRHRMHCHGLD